MMGKPASVIYEAAMAEMGLKASDLLAIGDSMEHDIAGANALGIATLFVAGAPTTARPRAAKMYNHESHTMCTRSFRRTPCC